MKVSEKMSMQGAGPSERLTPEQERLLWLIGGKTPTPIEEVSDQMDDVRFLIRAGRVCLVTRQFAWGLEFALALRTMVAEPHVERANIRLEASRP